MSRYPVVHSRFTPQYKTPNRI
uniref:Uncharacterized protein n=1 Tax=Anguilla anguilla TaxID=7936 RepID=A0A0E9Q9N8_ANGAN